ncbi:hypothetical protein Tamer19_06970 [Cupriavidus sp. TA19]|nr:hypothetical protein Tamer19_06970 [Cupriavidus sp. TA19]
MANANNRVARVANSTAIKTAKRVANKGAASKVNRADKDARDVLALMASTDFKL